MAEETHLIVARMQKDKGRSQGSNIPSRACPSDLTSFHWAPSPKGSTTSQKCHKLTTKQPRLSHMGFWETFKIETIMRSRGKIITLGELSLAYSGSDILDNSLSELFIFPL